jgi:hypothetical protein
MSEPVLPAYGDVSISTDLTPESLWPFVSDPSVPAMFSTELQEVRVRGTQPPSVATVIEGTNARGDFRWTTESYVVVCDEPWTFSWATGDEGDPTATWTLTVSVAPDGSTLTHSVVFHANKAPLGPAVEKDPLRAQEIVDGRMESVLANMKLTIEGIATLARAKGEQN